MCVWVCVCVCACVYVGVFVSVLLCVCVSGGGMCGNAGPPVQGRGHIPWKWGQEIMWKIELIVVQFSQKCKPWIATILVRFCLYLAYIHEWLYYIHSQYLPKYRKYQCIPPYKSAFSFLCIIPFQFGVYPQKSLCPNFSLETGQICISVNNKSPCILTLKMVNITIFSSSLVCTCFFMLNM